VGVLPCLIPMVTCMLRHMAGPDLNGIVNPRMLAWARESARLDVETAATKAGTSVERLQEWEAGTRVPTLTQLRTLGSTYKRSMGIFFLREAPRAGVSRPVDYRRFELSTDYLISPQLAAGLREAEAKRDAALDIFVELEDEPPRFDLHIPTNTHAEVAAQQIAERLGVTMATRRAWVDEYAALAGWRTAIEALGVIVIQLSGVSVQEMRGAAIATSPLPIILLNASDSPLGRLFSMLHELTHLVRSESALCDEIEDAPRSDVSQQVEIYCNHVSGALLVPQESLLRHPLVQGSGPGTAWGREELGSLRRFFWASREVVLRRLLILHRTSPAHYSEMREAFEAEYAAMRQKPREGFVPFPRRVVLGNGRFLTQLVLNAYASSAITGAELSRILGTKLDHLPKIADIVRERATS
jgi:Zn-dependent peptidase ImmA (M78 family)/transcriptional regulator with XRE-family HTH domain